MHEIIDNLYLGNRTDAVNQQLLENLNIKAIVNCCTRLEFPLTMLLPDADYFFVNVEDASNQFIKDYFIDVSNYIEMNLQKNKKVLIHCLSGVSRSPTITIAFLVSKRKFYLLHAFFLVQSKRNIIRPNVGFMCQLCDFEISLFTKNETSWVYHSICEQQSQHTLYPESDKLGELLENQTYSTENMLVSVLTLNEEMKHNGCLVNPSKKDSILLLPSINIKKYISWYSSDIKTILLELGSDI